MMMTFITQGGEGRGKTNKRKATKSEVPFSDDDDVFFLSLFLFREVFFQSYFRRKMPRCELKAQRMWFIVARCVYRERCVSVNIPRRMSVSQSCRPSPGMVESLLNAQRESESCRNAAQYTCIQKVVRQSVYRARHLSVCDDGDA